MNSIALNFVPLRKQNNCVTIYRSKVLDSSQPKQSEDLRARLPEYEGDEEWAQFDISISAKNGYQEYQYKFFQNPVLTVNLIHREFLEMLGAQTAELKFYVPNNAIALKEVRFITEEFDEGNSEIIVKPYFLRETREFGFLIDHKFSRNENQPFNKQTLVRSFSLDRSGRPNIYFYKDKKLIIEKFSKNTLSRLLSGSSLSIHVEFSSLPAKKLDVKTYMVGSENTARSQFMGIRTNGPYRRMDGDVRFLFLFTERTRSLARDVYLGLIGRLFPSQFPGLEKMFYVKINKDNVDHHIVSTFNAETMPSIEERVQQFKTAYPNHKLILVAVLPKGFKGVDVTFDAYGYLKLITLRNHLYCQVISEDTFFKKDQLKWSISNIGLQIFCKLGGAPWLVQSAKSNCLMFGLGSVQERVDGRITKYTAYTVCLDSRGDFKYIKPLSSSEDENIYLGELRSNLKKVLSSELGNHYRSIVLHLPRKISKNEIAVIKSVGSEIREDDEFEVIVMRVNTKHKFLGFSDHNTCVPYESTYIQISKNEFLIWAEGLQYGKEVLHKRVSEPLYVEFIEAREDWGTKKECLQEILNLTGANWRGFNSKAQPITILYSRLIAKFMKEFSHLEDIDDINIVSTESEAPWFL